MERIETLMIMAVAVCTLTVASFAGYHAADRSYVASLPVVQFKRVVVVAPVVGEVTDASRQAI